MQTEKLEKEITLCGIDIEKEATKQYNLDETLPWDFINIGVKKEWFIEQYKNALAEKPIVPCEFKCSNCGVCSTFKNARKTIKDDFTSNYELKPKEIQQTKGCKILSIFCFIPKQKTCTRLLAA